MARNDLQRPAIVAVVGDELLLEPVVPRDLPCAPELHASAPARDERGPSVAKMRCDLLQPIRVGRKIDVPVNDGYDVHRLSEQRADELVGSVHPSVLFDHAPKEGRLVASVMQQLRRLDLAKRPDAVAPNQSLFAATVRQKE